MRFYKVLRNLSFGPWVSDGNNSPAVQGVMIYPDSILPETFRTLRQGIDILTERGAIVEVDPPALSDIPGFKRRAERLSKVGIVNLDELFGFSGDDQINAKKRAEWLDYALNALIVKKPKAC